MIIKEKDIKEDKVPKHIVNIAWILVLGALLPLLDSTMVNIAIKNIGVAFAAGLNSTQWTITGYVLAMAFTVPFAGWAIQRFNGKWLMIGANILFLIGSILSGFSGDINSLIFFRLIQGVASGIIVTLIATLIAEIAGNQYIGKLMSIIGIPIVFGPIIGPTVGALILQYASWNWLFFINIPVGLIAIIGMILKLPNFTPSNPSAKFDFIGIGLLGLCSTILIYGIVEFSSQNSFTLSISGFITTGILSLLIYILYANKKKEEAILPLSLFKLRSFSAVSICLFLSAILVNGPMLLLPLFFQNITGLTVLEAGLILIPQGFGMLALRPKVGKMVDDVGARNITLLSLILLILGTIPFVFFDNSTSWIIICIVLFIRGMGAGGIIIPLMSDAFTGMEGSHIAQASVGTRIVQNIGGAFASALIASVITFSLQNKVLNVINLTTAYHDGFILVLVLSFVMFIPVMFLTNKKSGN
jgi:EmrB/QacA subfamily drug resistance transporter